MAGFDKEQVLRDLTEAERLCETQSRQESRLYDLERKLEIAKEAATRNERLKQIGYKPEPNYLHIFLLGYGVMMGISAIVLPIQMLNNPDSEADIPFVAVIFTSLLLAAIAFFSIKFGFSKIINSVKDYSKNKLNYNDIIDKDLANAKIQVINLENDIIKTKNEITSAKQQSDVYFNKLGIAPNHRHTGSTSYLKGELNKSWVHISSYDEMNKKLNEEMKGRAIMLDDAIGNITDIFAHHQKRQRDEWNREQAYKDIDRVAKSLDDINRKLK